MDTALSRDYLGLAGMILPGFGFIGTAPDFTMALEVDATVDLLELAIQGPDPEFLSLGEIQFYGADGQEMKRRDICAAVSMSSAYGGNTADGMSERFYTGQSVHSDKEARPVLRIEMKHPVALSRITLCCNADATPRRIQHLVATGSQAGQAVYDYNNSSETGLLTAVAALAEGLGQTGTLTAAHLSQADKLERIRAAILRELERGGTMWDARQLMQFVPIFAQGHRCDRFHITVCAAVLLRLMAGKTTVPTGDLRFLSAMLSSDLRLELLRDEANRLKTLHTGKASQIVLSKHSIHDSRLLRDRKLYMNSLRKVMTALDNAGVSGMLCYGTLLGAVRDKGFLPHDDDVDILYVDDATSAQQAQANSEKVIAQLRAQGFDVWGIGKANFHVTCDGAAIDVFYSWQEGEDKICLLMEKFEQRSIDRDILLPPSKIKLYGQTLPAPRDPAAFLEARYGAGWPYADPYHEWPWSVRHIVTAVTDDLRDVRSVRAATTRKQMDRPCMVAWGQRVGAPTPPKNSLPIIHVAKSLGFDAIELDVRLSADLVPVLAHDDLLKGPGGEIFVSRTKADVLGKFCLGSYEGKDAFIHPLADALPLVGDKDVMIDPRIGSNNLFRVREVVDACDFDPARLQFCVYDAGQARALSQVFPESVLLYKIGKPSDEVGDLALDEAVALGMDGVMLIWPLYEQEFAGFMDKLRARNLRVLYYIHGSGDPTRPYKDDRTKSLERMRAAGVDYITSTAWDLPLFKEIVGLS